MKLFERAEIGSLELKNRVAMAPMGTAGMADADFGYSRRLIDFYAARAKGGVGMIITGAAIVNTGRRRCHRNPGIRRVPDRSIPNGRLRFPLELIGATRAMVGADFPIIYKFTVEHYIPGSRHLEEGLELARRLERAGVDALHVDGGWRKPRSRS